MSPLDAANKNRFDPWAFGCHGVAPIGYAAFAFALGATAGVLLRRTVPAMAATLVGFVAARLAVEHWVRPNLAVASPQVPLALDHGSRHPGRLCVDGHRLSLIPPQVTIPNDWVLSTAVVDKSGHALDGHYLLHACPAYGQCPNALPTQQRSNRQHAACINKLSATFHTVVTYQPASRFWPFQWAEMGIFLAAALALCGLTYWWLRRQYA